MKTRFLLAALLLAATLPLAAQVPQIINYQGKIAVGSTPFTGTGQFRFALVNSDASTSYWSNDGSSTAGSEPTAAVSLPVVNGLYIAPLGDATLANMTAIPATVFANADVRVRVWFNDGSTGSQLLSPDQRITSVGYAMVAGSVPDGAITTSKVADAAITTAKLAPAARPKHDRQMAFSGDIWNTGGGIAPVSLITKDLGETGSYLLQYQCRLYSNAFLRCQFTVDGVVVSDSVTEHYNGGTNGETLTMTAIVPGIASGKVVRVLVLNGSGSATWHRLIIDGVPSSQVVP